MDFIFDQFVELKTPDMMKTHYISMASIIAVHPREIDTCDVHLIDGTVLVEAQIPARVLIQKIAQRRQEGQKLLLRAAVK